MSEQIVPCRLLAQGNRDRQEGVAIARMGSKLLIRYRIQDGTERERWLGPDRYDVDLDVSALPRYKREKVPARKFDKPVEAVSCKNGPGSYLPLDEQRCKRCGSRLRFEINYNERYSRGWAAVGYVSHSHIVRAEKSS